MRIPREHQPEILKRAGRGESAAGIATWLETLGVRVSDRAIRALLAKTRAERGDAAKVAVRETLAPVVTSDLDELDAIRARLRGYEEQAADEGNLDLAVRSAKEQAAVLDKKLHYAGADEPTTPEGITAAVIVLPPETED